MSIVHISNITWKEFEKLPKEKCIASIVLSPIEEHGPHLPLGTDFIIATDFFNSTLDVLEREHPNYTYLIYPSFALGYNQSISDFPGTFSFKTDTIKALLVDLCESFIRNNISKILIFNHHLDLGQVKSIQEAKRYIQTKYNINILDISGSLIYSDKSLNKERDEKNIHADMRETSYLLYRFPHMVKDIYKELPPITLDMKEFYRGQKKYFSQMGVSEGYIGSPSQSTVQKGEVFYNKMLEEGVSLILNYIKNGIDVEISENIKKKLDYIR